MKRGRSRKKIDGNEITELIACGCTLKQMTKRFGCHRDTIYSRFSKEIEKGRKKANSMCLNTTGV